MTRHVLSSFLLEKRRPSVVGSVGSPQVVDCHNRQQLLHKLLQTVLSPLTIPCTELRIDSYPGVAAMNSPRPSLASLLAYRDPTPPEESVRQAPPGQSEEALATCQSSCPDLLVFAIVRSVIYFLTPSITRFERLLPCWSRGWSWGCFSISSW